MDTLGDLICPSCGSPVQITANGPYLICDYCGNLIEDNGGLETVVDDDE